MNKIIPLRAFTDPTQIPTLVLIDMQKEYVASSRALSLEGPEPAIENCRRALAHARLRGIPVAFVRWRGTSPFFNPATPFSGWIEGFVPTRDDAVFERSRPSCYASTPFADMMAYAGNHVVLAGFAGEAACLATAIDAFHKGQRLTFLEDASASHGLGEFDASEVHGVISRIVELYGDVCSTQSWIASTTATATRHESRV
ncbi:isochorismatase family cysteine hydrolase [Bradyrhizobium sp. LHD-71]|uniref:cysteine hydrolase family protein n=1 Tax=Bradyrhizobium sp. LHD-71 TaxID=3072141 RepID=UPI002810302E|nr:isochorismatase family cysteine hydrolase [Bradyrhizobium sp. LHD-71]MDQ8727159.1 isochorismatase family cysteine hydrolase [Bradyrhizobium sp. LHD-71]